MTADSGPLTLDCVERVLASRAPFELILVDNASTDGVPAQVEARHAGDARVRILRNELNLGFGPACNRGAALAQGDALLFLNPDCLIEVDTVAVLRTALEESAAALLGLRVLDANGHDARGNRRRDPSLRRALCSLSGLARLERRWPGLAGIEMPPGESAASVEWLEAVSGACMLVRRSAFEAIGGFDEAYFLHCEDLDLCRRLRDGGFRVGYVHGARVRHAQGSSSHGRAVFVARHKHRGMWRYFSRHDPSARNWLLRGIVRCGIWAHFAVIWPGLWLRQRRAH